MGLPPTLTETPDRHYQYQQQLAYSSPLQHPELQGPTTQYNGQLAAQPLAIRQQLVPRQPAPHQQQLVPHQPEHQQQQTLVPVTGVGQGSPFSDGTTPPSASELGRRVDVAVEQMEQLMSQLNQSGIMFDQLNAKITEHVNEENEELQQRDEQLTILEKRLNDLL